MIDEEKKEMIDAFWDVVKKLDILIAWEHGNVYGRHSKNDNLWAFIYDGEIDKFMDEYIFDDNYIEARLFSSGAIGVNLTEENLCGCLEATDDEIWSLRPETGCKEEW